MGEEPPKLPPEETGNVTPIGNAKSADIRAVGSAMVDSGELTPEINERMKRKAAAGIIARRAAKGDVPSDHPLAKQVKEAFETEPDIDDETSDRLREVANDFVEADIAAEEARKNFRVVPNTKELPAPSEEPTPTTE